MSKKSQVINKYATKILDTHFANRKAYLLVETPYELLGTNLRYVKPSKIPFTNFDRKLHHCFILGDDVVMPDSTDQRTFYRALVEDFLDGDIARINDLAGKVLTTNWKLHLKYNFAFPGFSREDNPEIG